MFVKITRLVLPIVAVIILVATFIVNRETDKANTLVEAANLAVEEGNKSSAEASKKFVELYTQSNLDAFPGNRADLTPLAQETADLFGKSAESFRLAASQFEEATTQKVNDVVIEYWKLKVAQFKKLAEARDTGKAVALLILDEKVTETSQLDEQVPPLTDKMQKLTGEATALSEQAAKLEADNKDKFE